MLYNVGCILKALMKNFHLFIPQYLYLRNFVKSDKQNNVYYNYCKIMQMALNFLKNVFKNCNKINTYKLYKDNVYKNMVGYLSLVIQA